MEKNQDERFFETMKFYQKKLLHLSDQGNRLIDICVDEQGNPTNKDTFVLCDGKENFGSRFFKILASKVNQGPSVILDDSAKNVEAQDLHNESDFVCTWSSSVPKDDSRQAQKLLDAFVGDAYKDISQKGYNPLFLSVGAIRWKVIRRKDEEEEIMSPLLIIPIKLIRGLNNQPVKIEFIEDESYLNECFYQLFADVNSTLEGFPMPDIKEGSRTLPEDLNNFDIDDYISRITEYVERHRTNSIQDRTMLEFYPDVVAISKYTHEDICMYRDIMHHEDKIYAHPVIRRIFAGADITKIKSDSEDVKFVLRFDNVQRDLTERVINGGENIKVQGPPGTGKTQTIANMLAAALYRKKKVLFVSKKTAALEEVYNKLPKELKPFVLKINTEKENTVAMLNPNTIHKSLLEVSRLEMAGHTQVEINSKSKALSQQYKKAKDSLAKDYYEMMFEPKNGFKLYNVIVDFCKNMDEECPLLQLPVDLSKLNYEKMLTYQNEVKVCGELVKKFTNNFSFKSTVSPWYGVKNNVVSPAIAQDKIDTIRKTITEIDQVICRLPIVERMSIFEWAIISGIKLSDAEIRDYLSLKNIAELPAELDRIIKIRSVLDRFDEGLGVYVKEGVTSKISGMRCPSIGDEFDDVKLNDISGLNTLFDEKTMRLFLRKHDEIEKISKDFYEKAVESNTHFNAFVDVFKKDEVTEKEAEILLKARKKLATAIEEKVDSIEKIGFFKKGAFVEVKDIFPENGRYISVKRILEAIEEYGLYVELKAKVQTALENMRQIFERKIEETEMSYINQMLHITTKSLNTSIIAREMNNFYNQVEVLFSNIDVPSVRSLMKNGTVGDIKKLFDFSFEYNNWVEAVDRLNDRFVCETNASHVILDKDKEYSLEDLNDLIKDVLAIKVLSNTRDAVSIIASLRKYNKDIIDTCDIVAEFAMNNTTSLLGEMSVYHDSRGYGIKELNVFVREITENSSLQAMLDFISIVTDGDKQLIRSFFAPFIKGERTECKKYAFEKMFEQAVMGAIINSYKEKLNKFAGGQIEKLINAIDESEMGIIENNKVMIALQEIARVNKMMSTTPNTFLFLSNERTAYRVARRYFKDKAAEIMSLKSCFIMSPATVSTVLKSTEFENFDIAIFDEASQIEPQELIPVVFRAKQCVIIGDEYQMPPISHFKTESKIDGEDDFEKVESGLDLIKRNEAMDSVSLRCHYRSKTETLIAYSERYYDDMLTFPSVVSYSKNLGVRDYYLPNATSEQGCNEQEAEKVLDLIREHYRNNEELSLGVLTFGVKQSELIMSKIAKDSTLHKIVKEQENEGRFFVRPVEQVQGQEIDHMIMSMTYGKRGSSSVLGNFGDLGRSDIGEKVFNVAASRAKSMLTVVHSFKSADIGNTRQGIKYLGDFLDIVEKYKVDGNSESGISVTEEGSDNAFFNSVKKYLIEECKVPADRIIVNYGATPKSLRIPIVILNKDRNRAEVGIFCESLPIVANRTVAYLDYLIRYPKTLMDRGWDKTTRIFAYDWISSQKEKNRLALFIRKNVTPDDSPEVPVESL